MIIDGEKWACEACVRGHRVSNCQHADRPLQHINKKGRPVSQCQHCRSMRKSRSAHIKCDCGEKTHKCAHLKQTVEGHKESCCCNHGGRCTCSHKKEQSHLDPVPESDSDNDSQVNAKATTKTTVRRRRANTTHSDGVLSFDENGHHKPTYKHSKASQKCGPYQLNRGNSLHSAGSTSNRSMDNLHGESRVSRDSPASTSSLERRRVKSETASPLLSASSFSQLNSQLPPLDLSSIEYPPYVPNSFDMFSSISDADQGLFSAGLSATSVDWSHYDLDFNNTSRTAERVVPSSYSQTRSFGGFDFNGSEQAPTLTTTTSGDVSEVEDLMGPGIDDFDSTAGFSRTSTGTNGFSMASAAARSSLINQSDYTTVDYEGLRLMKASNKFLPTPASTTGEEPTLSAATRGGANGYQYIDEEAPLWMGDYAHGLPAMTDSPDAGMLYWDNQ